MQPFVDFDGRSTQLTEAAERCRRQLVRANSDPQLCLAERQSLIAELLGACSDGVWIETPFTCEFGLNIRIGARTFVNRHCQLHDTAAITIGDDVLIGPGVQIVTASHPVHPAERHRDGAQQTGDAPYRTLVAPVHIGDRVWIGAGAIILAGVTIGHGSTIGAGSLVTRDIPPMAVALGQPARVVKHLSA
jgi:maltose O-acetyltransferase